MQKQDRVHLKFNRHYDTFHSWPSQINYAQNFKCVLFHLWTELGFIVITCREPTEMTLVPFFQTCVQSPWSWVAHSSSALPPTGTLNVTTTSHNCIFYPDNALQINIKDPPTNIHGDIIFHWKLDNNIKKMISKILSKNKKTD